MTIDAYTIEQINAFLTSTDQTEDDRIRECAEKYAQACEEVNNRLLRCRLFLQSGHRTQAIRYAEQEPSLQKQCELLSLHGLVDLWEDLVSSYGWARFQPVKSDLLTLVYDSYQTERETADVLYQYREMALAKAPLSDRLTMVRQLSILEQTNPVWRNDIENLESNLMAELARRGADAMRNNEMDELITVVTQHDQQEWEAPYTPAYNNFLRQAIPIVYKEHSIPLKVRKSRRAYQANDTETFNRLHDETTQMFAIARAYHPNFHVSEEVKTSFDSMTGKRQNLEMTQRMGAFGADLKTLQSMLGGNHTEEQIEMALIRAESHGIEIPPLVHAQIDAYNSNTKDTKILTIVAITSLIVLVIGLSVLAFLMWVRLKGS
ncbi:MAG: hypothetical protein AB8B55_13760 [Mariniblastus sp.]